MFGVHGAFEMDSVRSWSTSPHHNILIEFSVSVILFCCGFFFGGEGCAEGGQTEYSFNQVCLYSQVCSNGNGVCNALI